MMPRDNNSELRKKQINTLKIFNDNVVDVCENVEYSVTFVVSDIQMALNIFLPPEFPNEKPILTLSHIVSHPWIPPHGKNIIGAPGLLNFSNYSDLGRVVQAIVREFVKNPPMIPEQEPLSETDHFWKTGSAVGTQITSSSSTGNVAFPELINLSTYQLQQMLDSPDVQDNFLQSLPQLNEMERLLNDSISEITTLANVNKSLEAELGDLKTNINNRIEVAQEHKVNYESLMKVHNKLSQNYLPHNIMETLQESVSEADRRSEKLAKDFLDGTTSIDAFLKMFVETRSRSHKLRARLERLSHQLTQFDEAAI